MTTNAHVFVVAIWSDDAAPKTEELLRDALESMRADVMRMHTFKVDHAATFAVEDTQIPYDGIGPSSVSPAEPSVDSLMTPGGNGKWGMFSEEGNAVAQRMMDEVRTSVRVSSWSRNGVQFFVSNRIKSIEILHPEVHDTAVREQIMNELDEIATQEGWPAFTSDELGL